MPFIYFFSMLRSILLLTVLATLPLASAESMTFTADKGLTLTSEPPATAILLNPDGNISDDTPTYSWSAVSNSTWYYLWVNDRNGNRIKQWYTAAQAGCAGGSGTCSITPATLLAEGSGLWWVQTWNSSGYAPWSLVLSIGRYPMKRIGLHHPWSFR